MYIPEHLQGIHTDSPLESHWTHTAEEVEDFNRAPSASHARKQTTEPALEGGTAHGSLGKVPQSERTARARALRQAWSGSSVTLA